MSGRPTMMREPRPIAALGASPAARVLDQDGAVRAEQAEKRAIVSMGRQAYARRLVRALQATYDAAQTGRENERHWAAADSLSANAANSAEVRRTLRNRARYEVANNTYARGIINTLADFVVGTGARLQLLGADPDVNRVVEAEFARWARAAGLGQKLWTMRVAQGQDGEAFGTLVTNPGLPTRVKLDLRLFEAEQVATPAAGFSALGDPGHVDGIQLDRFGNPVVYEFLRRHPGETAYAPPARDSDPVPADKVVHLFRAERPGQARGIPEITAALPLFAMLRRYTLAVLLAAENAASIGGVMESEQTADDADEVDPLEEFDLERGSWLTLPAGWKIRQMEAQQPVQTYGEFKAEVINEIARCLSMPYNIAAGNSSKYNYASGRLDHQSFYRRVTIDRAALEAAVLDRVFEAWLDEASLITGYLPQAARSIDRPPHQWVWPGLEHVDPAKEATAQQTRLNAGTTNLAIEAARSGHDWEELVRQRARELELMRELGMVGQSPESAAARAADPEEDDA